MKKSPIFNLKPWNKIHPPLPRTPRESQQLLTALTSSFRRQLDALDTNETAKSTDQHVHSILKHPLFRVVPSKPGVILRLSEQEKLLQHRSLTDPMAVFDELVAAGSLAGRDIHLCLSSQMVIAGSKSGDPREVLQQYGAAARVVSWFWAADSESRKTLFKSRKATHASLKFMAAERLQATAMVWLRMLIKGDLGGLNGKIPPKAARTLFRNFLQDFIMEEVRYGQGLESSIRYFLQATQMCSFPPDSLSFNNREFLLSGAVSYLCQWIVDHHLEDEVKRLPPQLYDEFCGIIANLKSLPILVAAVLLYHPTSPHADLLLERTKEAPPQALDILGDKEERDLLSKIYVDAFQLLLEQDRDEDASWVAKLAKRLLSDGVADSKMANKTRAPDAIPQGHEYMRLLSGINGLS